MALDDWGVDDYNFPKRDFLIRSVCKATIEFYSQRTLLALNMIVRCQKWLNWLIRPCYYHQSQALQCTTVAPLLQVYWTEYLAVATWSAVRIMTNRSGSSSSFLVVRPGHQEDELIHPALTINITFFPETVGYVSAYNLQCFSNGGFPNFSTAQKFYPLRRCRRYCNAYERIRPLALNILSALPPAESGVYL